MESQNSPPPLENRLREKRQALALSQKQLADRAGITRQAVSALEASQYSPATSVALQLARALEGVGELASLSAAADGIVVEADPRRRRAQVRLFKARESVRRKVVVGGC